MDRGAWWATESDTTEDYFQSHNGVSSLSRPLSACLLGGLLEQEGQVTGHGYGGAATVLGTTQVILRGHSSFPSVPFSLFFVLVFFIF